MGKWSAHVVLVPGFGIGHGTPFFELASRLTARAIKVTILDTEFGVNRVWSHQAFRRWAPGLRREGIDYLPVKDGMYEGTLQSFYKCVRESSEEKFIAAFESHMELLMSSVDFPPPCCIISDMLVGWTQALAKKFGIPRYILHIQSAANVSLMLHVPTLLAEGRLPITEENRNEPIQLPGTKLPLQPSDLPTDLSNPESVQLGLYEFNLRMSRRAAEALIVLVNTFRELEEDVLAALDELHSRAVDQQVPKVIPIGPLGSADMPEADRVVENEDERHLMQWLDTQSPRSVVYIAFGTLVKNAQEQMEMIAHGLEASEQPFLWAAGTLKKPDDQQPKLLSECLPPGFEERTRMRGRTVTFFVPQLRILKHPACGAFLTHCGWNTVLESLSVGVPLIAWPRQFEQRMTARFLVDTAKVAAELVEVRRGVVTREEIARVVRLVMQQEEGQVLRSNAGALKQFAASSAHSNPYLESFLDVLKQSSNTQKQTQQ